MSSVWITVTQKETAQHQVNNASTVVAQDIIQLCVKSPRTHRYNHSQSRQRHRRSTYHRKNSNHLTEADHTGAQAEAPHAGSQGHPITTEGTGDALHHTHTRLATFLISALKSNEAEGKLITDTASDGQTSFPYNLTNQHKTRYQTHTGQSRPRHRCQHNTT